MSNPPSAEQCHLLREVAEISLPEARRALLLAQEPEFGGDVVLAVAYIHAASLAMNVRGDRHAWNLNIARERAPGLREWLPALDAAFPDRNTAPSP